MKLIDKDALVAEIERRIKTNKECMLGLRNLDYYQGKVDALNDTISFINSLQKEPVSEELEDAAVEWFNSVKYKSDLSGTPINAFKAGANWQKEHLWKPADGDDLPDIDREVIALLDNGKVVFTHRPPEYWDGKDIITGKVTRNYPKTYGKGGWNIPDVRWWLDVELPKEIEL